MLFQSCAARKLLRTMPAADKDVVVSAVLMPLQVSISGESVEAFFALEWLFISMIRATYVGF